MKKMVKNNLILIFVIVSLILLVLIGGNLSGNILVPFARIQPLYQLNISISTLQDEYFVGDDVDLTDPPAEGTEQNNLPPYTASSSSQQSPQPEKDFYEFKVPSLTGIGGLNAFIVSSKNEYVKSTTKPEEKERIAKRLESVSKNRKFGMIELAEKNPEAFLALAIKPSDREKLPKEAKDNIEKEVTLDATIEVWHIDDFENPENSKFEYFLQKGTERFNFYPTQNPNLVSGTKVKVIGYRLDNTIVAYIGGQTFQIIEQIQSLDSVGDQRTLVLLVNFPGSGTPPFTPEQAHNLVFNGQFQNFMQEQSYGQVSFSGNAYGWITLLAPPTSACDVMIEEPEIAAFLEVNSVNLAYYDRVIIVVAQRSGGCSDVGKSDHFVGGQVYNLSVAKVGALYFDSPPTWGAQPFPWTVLDFLLSHEVGHSLGVVHANGWDCGDQVLYGNCAHIEYGNYFDTMGNSRSYSLHFNGFYKQLLGWLSPSSILQISQTGRYTIAPLEYSTGEQVAIITRTDPDGRVFKPYYLEHRQATGFDSRLSEPELFSNVGGLFINKIKYEIYPRLLDSSATSLGWTEDLKQATLNIGQSFFDEQDYSVRLQPVSVGEPGITFDATFLPMPCTRRQPFINSYYIPYEVIAGTVNTASVHFFNPDSIGCSDSRFRISPVTLPTGWSFSSTPEEISLPGDGAIGVFLFEITVPLDTQPGTYPVTFAVTNIDSGEQITISGSISVRVPLTINEIIPDSGVTGTEIEIRGTGFTTSGDLYLEFSLPQVGSTYFSVSSQDDSTIHFTTPPTIQASNGGDEIPSPPGIYYIYLFSVSTFEMSNEVNFELLPSPSCSDEVDNDNDSFIDFSRSVSAGCEWANIRNDDGRNSLTEWELEYATVCFTGPDRAPIPGCWAFDHDQDNDVDSTDYQAFLACYNTAQHPDQHCESTTDNSEIGTPFQCGDEIDNDADGTIDYPTDGSCVSTQDTTENWPVQCQDAKDNDNDGLTDYPNDPDCANRSDDSESRPKSQILNNGENSATGILYMEVEKFVNGQWEFEDPIYYEQQTVPANGVLALDTIWNPLGWTPQQTGEYKAVARFDIGNREWRADYNFTVIEPQQL